MCIHFVVSLGHIQIARTTTLGFEVTIRQHKGDLNTSHQDIPSESGDGAKKLMGGEHTQCECAGHRDGSRARRGAVGRLEV